MCTSTSSNQATRNPIALTWHNNFLRCTIVEGNPELAPRGLARSIDPPPSLKLSLKLSVQPLNKTQRYTVLQQNRAIQIYERSRHPQEKMNGLISNKIMIDEQGACGRRIRKRLCAETFPDVISQKSQISRTPQAAPRHRTRNGQLQGARR